MTLIVKDVRRIEKYTEVPNPPLVAPSSDHTDGSWNSQHIYKGELYIDLVNKTIYTSDGSTIFQLKGVPQTLQEVLATGNDAAGQIIQLNGANSTLKTTLGVFPTLDTWLETNGILKLGSGRNFIDFKGSAETLRHDISALNGIGGTSPVVATWQNKPITVAGLDDITTAINNLINAAPGALDTLNELAAALGNDPNFAATVNNAIAARLKSDGTTPMTGDLDMNTNNVAIKTSKIKTASGRLEWYLGLDKLTHDISAISGGLGSYLQTWRAKAGTVAHLDDIINPIVGAISTETTHTGSLGETYIDGFLIPAGTLETGDYIEINYATSKVGSAGTCLLRARVDTTGGIVSGSNIVYKDFPAYNPNPTNDSKMLKVISGANTLFYIGDIDWTIDQYINITLQLADITDTVKLESFYVKRYKP